MAAKVVKMMKGAEGAKVPEHLVDKFLKDGWSKVTIKVVEQEILVNGKKKKIKKNVPVLEGLKDLQDNAKIKELETEVARLEKVIKDLEKQNKELKK